MISTTVASLSDNAAISTSVSGVTIAAMAAGDKAVGYLLIPNTNPTSVVLTVGGVTFTEIPTARTTRNKAVIPFYTDIVSLIASGAAVSASWVNTGTQNGGGALLVIGTMTPTSVWATGGPEWVAIRNSLSTTPAVGPTGTPSDSAAKYVACVAIGADNSVAAQVTADNGYTTFTEAINAARGMTLDASVKEFSAPVAAQSETWTATWAGSKNWEANILLFKELVPGAPVNTAAPVMSGTAVIGSTLSVTNGSWTNAPTGYIYQWQRSPDAGVTWQDIAGANGNTYLLPGDMFAKDLGCKLRCVVTATNVAGSSTPIASNVTTTVLAPSGQIVSRIILGPIAQTDAQHHRANTVLPVLPGEKMILLVGCSNADLVDANGNKQDVGIVEDVGGHTWVQDVEAQSSTDATRNTPQTLDIFGTTALQHSAQVFSTTSPGGLPAGSTITLTVHGMTAADPGTPDAGNNPAGYHGQSPWWAVMAISSVGLGGPVALDSRAHNVNVLTNHIAPTITTINDRCIVVGFHAGGGMGASAGWFTPMPGLTKLYDTPPALGNGGETDYSTAAEGLITTTGYSGGAGGSTLANKNVTNLIVAYSVPDPIPPPANTIAPDITGDLSVGSALAVTDGTWTGVPSGYTRQWQRDNHRNGVFADIAGATDVSYTLTADDLDNDIRCVVTATNAYGSTAANSNVVGPVTQAPPPPPTPPSTAGGTIVQFLALLQAHGSDVIYHHESGGSPCPCLTPEGFRDPQWHIEHPLEPVCNEEGILALVTEVLVKASVQPATIGQRGRAAERVNVLLGEIQRDDHFGIFPCEWNGHTIDFTDFSDSGDDFVIYDDRRFIVVSSDKIPDINGNPNHHWEVGLRLVKNTRPT